MYGKFRYTHTHTHAYKCVLLYTIYFIPAYNFVYFKLRNKYCHNIYVVRKENNILYTIYKYLFKAPIIYFGCSHFKHV